MAHSRLNAETNKGKRFEEFPQALAVCTRFFYPTEGLYARGERESRAHVPILPPLYQVIFGQQLLKQTKQIYMALIRLRIH